MDANGNARVTAADSNGIASEESGILRTNPLAHLNRRPRPPLNAKRFPMPGSPGKVLPSELDTARYLHSKGKPALTLAEFLVAAWDVLEPNTPLEWNWHLTVVCNHVEALLLDRPGPNGEPCPQNLLINVPPGSMKSLIFSVFAPAWMWLFRPSWRAIYASGTPSVVTRDSLKCRTLIKSDWYQKTFKPDWDISADQDEKQHFANTKGGFRKGSGAGGTVTGERADFLGVDDPNDAKEIHSKAHREAINERWWDAAFHNRIANPTTSKRGLIMQRLHEEDLAGYVLEKEKGEWAHLCIAMEYEQENKEGKDGKPPGDRPTWLGWADPRTEEGQLLAPERFTPKFLAGERKTLGSSGYAGQMQQRPVPASGNKFMREWWRFYTRDGKQHLRPRGCTQAPPRLLPVNQIFDEIIGSWDCAFKDLSSSDWVVGIVLGRIGADKYVLERKREHMGLSATQRAVLQQRLDWPDMFEIVVEDKANGTAVVETLSSAISGIVAVEPKGGKEARAAAIEPQVEAGNVYLPEGADWLDEWISEFASFPKGKHDDQVDSLSQALIKMGDEEIANTRRLLGL